MIMKTKYKLLLLFLFYGMVAFCQTEDVLKEFQKNTQEFQTFYSQGKYTEAIKPCKENLKIIDKYFGKRNANYATILNNLSELYRQKSNYDKALILGQESLQIRKEILGEDHIDYAMSLNNLGLLYTDKSHYSKALPLYTHALEIIERTLGKQHLYYFAIINNMALLHSEIGNYSKALPLYNSVLSFLESSGIKKQKYIMTLTNLAKLYQLKGNYVKALSLYKKALYVSKKISGEKHPNYAVLLNDLALLCKIQGNYNTALSLYKQSLEITKETFGKKHLIYAVALNNLAELYKEQRNYDKAISLLEEVIFTIERNFNDNHSIYAKCLNNLAGLYDEQGNYSKALLLYQKAIKLTKELLGKKHPDYALTINNLATLYKFQGNYDKALPLYQEVLRADEEILGKTHISYSTNLNNLALLYYEQGNFIKALPLLKQSLEIYQNHIYTNLQGIDNNFKNKGIEKIKTKIKILFFVFGSNKILESLPQTSYETLNAFKGLQLFVSNSIKGKLQNHPNKKVRELFEKLTQLKHQQNNLDKNKANYGERYKKLQSEIDQTSISLSNYSKEFKINFTPPTLELLQKHLKKDEVFIDYYLIGDDYYGAMLQHTGKVIWKKINLSTDLQNSIKQATKEETINALYKNNELFTALFSPFSEQIKGKKLIVSPDGLLHHIAFHAIPTPNGKNVGEEYQLQLISSSRSLYITTENNLQENSILFGGIDYDRTISMQTNSNLKNPFSPLRNFEAKQGFPNLKGSEIEVTEIGSILNSKIYKDEKATEKQFRAMDKQSPDILLLSTHGFYMPLEQKKTDKKDFLQLNNDKKPSYNIKEDPMMRSGLALSGANIAWLGKQTLPDENDGVLLAKEVSQLNLSNTKLVVLSACQTALGDITTGEGVFGLQRGFKQAGVDYIVASLWEVPDTDTKDLMVAFFNNLKQTHNPRQALLNARKEMKKQGKSIYQYGGFVVIR